MFKHIIKPAAVFLLASWSFTALSAPSLNSLWYPSSDIPVDEQFKVSMLSNGMRVVMTENHLPKQGLSIQMFIDAGSFQDPKDYPGLAHFLEHMAFNGSTHVAEGAMIPMLEKHGLAFGADTNATTSLGYTSYELDLPNATPEAIDTALFLLRETASELTLAPKAIKRERGVIQAERRVRNSHDFRSSLSRIQYLLGDTNVYQRLPIGTKEAINQIDQAALKAYYQNYYTPENTTLVISGNIKDKQLEQKIDKYFANWKTKSSSHEIVDPTVTYSLPNKTEAYANISPKNQSASVGLNFIAPEEDKPYSKAEHIEFLKEYIGIRALNYRLEQFVNQSDGKLRDLSASLSTESDVVSIRNISVETEQGEWRHGLQTIQRLLKQATTYGFSQQEIDRQIKIIEHSLQVDIEQSSYTNNSVLSDRVVNALDSKEPLISAITYQKMFKEARPLFTQEAINQTFQQQWTNKNARIYLADRQAPKDINQQLILAYQAEQKVAVNPYESKQATAFAYTDFGPAGKVTPLPPTQFGDIQRYQFDNGVRLNIKPTDIEPNTVYLNINFGNGRLGLSNENAPLSAIFGVAVAMSGMQQHNINQLQDLFTGRSMGLDLAMGDFHNISKIVLDSADVLDQLRVYASLYTDNGFRQEAWEAGIRQYQHQLASAQNDPNAVLNNHLSAYLFNQDARWTMPTVELLNQFNVKDLKPLLEQAIYAGPVEISLVGDITTEQAIEAVSSTFGALSITAQAPAKPYSVAMGPIKTKTVTLFHTGEANKAVVAAYWPIPDGRHPELNVKYTVLARALQTKLDKIVREEMGVSYSPWAGINQSNWFADFGYISLNSNTNTENVTAVEQAYKKIWQSLQAITLTPEEVEQLKKPILESLAHNQQYNQYWSSLSTVAQSQADLVENETKYTDALKAVTAADIQQLAKSIDIDKALKINVLPKK